MGPQAISQSSQSFPVNASVGFAISDSNRRQGKLESNRGPWGSLPAERPDENFVSPAPRDKTTSSVMKQSLQDSSCPESLCPPHLQEAAGLAAEFGRSQPWQCQAQSSAGLASCLRRVFPPVDLV